MTFSDVLAVMLIAAVLLDAEVVLWFITAAVCGLTIWFIEGAPGL